MSNHDKNEASLAALLRRLAVSLSLLLLASASGCAKYEDVTNDPNYGNFLVAMGTWKTKVPLTIREVEGKLMLLDLNNVNVPQMPPELAAVPVGSEIRIERLMLRSDWECSLTQPMGSVVDGPYAGKSLQLGSAFFPRPGPGPTDWTVLPNMLQRSVPAAGPN